jgi:trehalose-phosphatase
VLSGRPDVRINVLSGRTVADLRKRVVVGNVTYSGNHGLVIAGPGVEFEHPLSALARRAVSVGAGLIRKRIKTHVGAMLYQNGLSLSLNVGMMPPAGRRAVALLVDSLAHELRWLRLRWQKGHFGWDLLPEVGWTKGDALAHLMARSPGALAVAIGDGLSDEPMFERVQKAGLAVRVGQSRTSAANWFVHNPREVAALLKALT